MSGNDAGGGTGGERILERAVSAGVDVLAGAAVTDPGTIRGAVRAGDCGTDLHDAGLERGYAVAEDATGVALKALETEEGDDRERSASGGEDSP